MKLTAFTQGQTAFAASTVAGRLIGVQLTTQGSSTGDALVIYDHATAASGTVLFEVTGTGTSGPVTQCGWLQAGPAGVGLPYSNGLWVVSTASTGSAGVIVHSNGVQPFDGRQSN